MIEVSNDFNAYSGYYFAQSTKIHEDYNWDQLTKKAFKHLVEKFS
jgi:predicted AlkP superfamily phosphohydrolase/phosphomutase